MLSKIKFKSYLSMILICAMLVTAFAPVAHAEELQPTIPDLSEYSCITIDEIVPETTINDIIADTVISENEEAVIYDSQGYLLSGGDYVGNGATIVITENHAIAEVYKIRLYGDLDCNGEINAADLVDLRKALLNTKEPCDNTVADITADGESNILDLVRLKKQQVETADISQDRMFAHSSRFNWLNTIDVPFSINGFEEVFEDFSVVSNDIDLTFSRYYDSNNTVSNMLGVGWTASFEGNCTTYGDNSKIVKIYGQTPVVFELVGNEYVCDYSRATLTATNNGFVFIGDDGLTYTFNQSGYLISISDKNNNIVMISVDASGKIQKVTDSVGREYNYTYGENGLLASITDCIQRTVNYTYDSSNRLSAVTGVLGTVTESYEYNSNNKLIKVSDAFGNRISSISYEDNSGIILSVTDSDGIVTTYTYNPDNNSVTLLQDDTVTEQYIYNKYNYLTASNTDEGLQQNFYCNSYGDVVVTENADGSKMQYGYDSNGNPTKIITVTDDETVTENNKYDANGNLLSTTTGNETTVYTYDNKGNTLTVTKTDGEDTEITSYTYYDNGLVNTTVSDGVTTTYHYDDYWYPVRETSTDSEIVKHYNYNMVGWLISESGTGSGINATEYDNYYHYNLNGDTLKETKDNAVVSRTVYDDYGRIKQQISGAEYVLAYDGLEMSPSTDTYHNSWNEVPVGVRYYYGEDGKLSQIKASCYTVATDSNQKVTSVTAGNTVLAEYNYTDDAKELLSNVNYANGQSISYNYDTDGNITSLYYGDTLAYTYTYDTEGTLTSKINLIDSIQTDYAEDNFTVSSVADDGTLTELYTYKTIYVIPDDDSETSGTSIVPDDEVTEDTTQRIVETFNGERYYIDYNKNNASYDNVKFLYGVNEDELTDNIQINYRSKNIANLSYTFNDDNLPSGLTNTLSEFEYSYIYTYDNDGNISEISKSLKSLEILDIGQLPTDYSDMANIGSFDKKYYYDDAGQLVRVDDEEAKKTTVYEYDGTSGNIKSVTTYPYTTDDVLPVTSISTITYNYEDSNWSDLLTSYNGNALTYDALGNLLTYKGYTYSWEVGRRLARMTNGENTYSYKYDDNGIRTQKTINGVTTYYTTVDGRITGQYDGTNSIYFRYNADNSLIGFNLNGTEYIYIKNIQGDIEGILDQSGDLVVQYTYDAWGKVLSVTGSMADTVGIINPMRYRGYYYDNETGYYYLQSRYYNPEFCRFINADEPSAIVLNLENVTSFNLFTYCHNNPVNYVDPTGHIAASVIGAIIVGIIGAVGGYYLARWLANKLNLSGWKRNVFVAGLTALVTASAAAIGYFIGPYVAKAWSIWSAKLAGLVKGSYKSIAKITTAKMKHINVSKHLWSKIMKKVTNTQIQTVIHQGIRKGTWDFLSNGTVKILYNYKGRIIVITGKVVDSIFRIGDAWVWNGIGKP